MSREYKFNKYVFTFIFSIISMFVFLIQFPAYDSFYLTSDNALVNFFTEFEHSIKSFDIIYLTLWVFILYFYYNVYFDGKKYNKKNVIYSIIAIIFTIITILGKSYQIDNTLNTLYSSSMQIFKTIVFLFGYYLIYYAILKKIFSIKLDVKLLKKKHF